MTQNDNTGIIYLVGLGPGDAGYLNPNAAAALRDCDVVVLLLPSGSSAHTEAAWHCGRGGPVIVHSPERCQPELMYKLFSAITSAELELKELLDQPMNRLSQHFLAQRPPVR